MNPYGLFPLTLFPFHLVAVVVVVVVVYSSTSLPFVCWLTQINYRLTWTGFEQWYCLVQALFLLMSLNGETSFGV